MLPPPAAASITAAAIADVAGCAISTRVTAPAWCAISSTVAAAVASPIISAVASTSHHYGGTITIAGSGSRIHDRGGRCVDHRGRSDIRHRRRVSHRRAIHDRCWRTHWRSDCHRYRPDAYRDAAAANGNSKKLRLRRSRKSQSHQNQQTKLFHNVFSTVVFNNSSFRATTVLDDRIFLFVHRARTRHNSPLFNGLTNQMLNGDY